MEPPVQVQIADRYRSLKAAIDSGTKTSTELANEYGAMGNLLLAVDYADAAESFYLHAEAISPGDMRWPYYLGHVYMAKAEPPKAIDSFERALRIQPNDVATLVWFGNVQLDQGRPDLAEPRFSQALNVQPGVVAALYGLGRVALARRDYARAVEQLEAVLAVDRRASIAHYPLSLAYRGLGDTTRAESHLRQRGERAIGPPDPLMVELRGLVHGVAAEEKRGSRALDSGDYPAAVAAFREGIELAPDNPSLRHKLGTALSLTGDTAEAVEQFRETIRRSPNYAPAHYSLGVLLASSGKYAEAIEQLEAAVRDDPSYVEARLRLGELLGGTRQFERALGQFQKAIEIDPRAAEARFGYAGALVGLRRYAEARDSLRESAKLFPDQPRFAEALTKLEGVPGGK
jgi:tetratricopeptide (TPR) repeat protein